MEIVCDICLADDRNLQTLVNHEINAYFARIIGEMEPTQSLMICWECKANFKRIKQFEETARNSWNILKQFSKKKPLHAKCKSNLKRTPTEVFTHSDSTNNENDIKLENLIQHEDDIKKEEISFEEVTADPIKSDDNSDHLIGRSDDEMLCQIQEKQRLLGDIQPRPRKKKKKKDRPDMRTIELSHEEMWQERETSRQNGEYLNSEFKCYNCILGFSQKDVLLEHIEGKHKKENGDEVCSICSLNIDDVKEMNIHLKKHFKRYVCNFCGFRNSEKKLVIQHTMKHKSSKWENGTTRVQCSECDKTFSHKAGLINHKSAVHKLKNHFPCTQCNQVFRWKTSLKKHIDEIHEQKQNVKPYCQQCDIKFSSKCTYKRHLRISLRHVTVEEFKFICDHCSRKFSNKTKLRDHIEEKHLKRSFQCNLCFKPSKNRVCLDQHIRNVHKGRPNNRICDFCGKGFPTKIQLESHVRSHTGERPFICEYCPTTFTQQSNLYKHNRQVHLNMKETRKNRKKNGKMKIDEKKELIERQNCTLSIQPFPV